jgi:hypothetical protein
MCSARLVDGGSTHKEGIDIICLIGNPVDQEATNRFLLVGRGVLPTSKLVGNIDFDPNALFKTLKEELPRKGYESRRLLWWFKREGSV